MNKELAQKKRVFWHETGHFIAGYYNQQYHGYLGTERVVIERVELANQHVDYKGNREPKKPAGYRQGMPIKNPGALVASQVYGCFLQCIYLGNPILSCLDNDPRLNGYDDYFATGGVVFRFSLKPKDQELLYKIIYEQYEMIKNNTEFKALIKINIENLIEADSDIIEVDPTELEKRFSTFLKEHERAYLEFVEKLQVLFQPYSDRGAFGPSRTEEAPK
jgi:hypothetical protein